MSNLGERIKELRGSEAQTSFGRRFGKNKDTIGRYESGKNPPEANFLAALCRAYQVNPAWLLLGEGPKSPADKIGPVQPSSAIVTDVALAYIKYEATLVEASLALGVIAADLSAEAETIAINGEDNSSLIGLAYMARCIRKDIEEKIEQKRISPEHISLLL